MFTWEIQNVKIAEFCRKVPKVDLQESVWCVSWIREDMFESARRFLPYFTMFGISEFSLIWQCDRYLVDDILILRWSHIVP